MIDAFSPLRIDLFGNWSDHVDFLRHRPSRVINTAFCFEPDHFPVHVRVKRLKQPIICHRSIDLRTTRLLSYEDITNLPVLNGLHEYYPSTTPHEFETTLREKGGIEVITSSSVPLQCGLGTSSAMTVSLIMALWTLDHREFDNDKLAEQAYIVEKRSSQCGWQDHYAAVYGKSILIERHSSSYPPSITILPESFSSMLAQHAVVVFVSEKRHPEVKWSIEGNENILYAMDDIINNFMSMLPLMSLGRLKELIMQSDSLSRNFMPHEFCSRLDSILKLLASLDCYGFLTGLGPAAVIISSEPNVARSILAREQIRSYHLYPPPSGAVALSKSSSQNKR